MHNSPLRGLIAATYTPLKDDGGVHLSQIPKLVDFLCSRQRVAGLYVCGSTGEGVSLTGDERRQLAEAFVTAADGRLPVIVQVGHNSLREAAELAAHAQDIGATAVSANAPSYFKVTDVDTLVASMAEIASAAPELPFYYYHIPHLTGAAVSMMDFLDQAERIPNLVGIKYTAPTLHEYRACREAADASYDVLWGSDEMLLPALAMGAAGAVGSTYNVAAPVYQQVIDAFHAGELAAAQQAQDRCNAMIRTIYRYPFHSAMKYVLELLGVPCGPCRLPQQQLHDDQRKALQAELTEIGFFDWNPAAGNAS